LASCLRGVRCFSEPIESVSIVAVALVGVVRSIGFVDIDIHIDSFSYPKVSQPLVVIFVDNLRVNDYVIVDFDINVRIENVLLVPYCSGDCCQLALVDPNFFGVRLHIPRLATATIIWRT
jgi:hypothetical protein